jgi:hypothetical protein
MAHKLQANTQCILVIAKFKVRRGERSPQINRLTIYEIQDRPLESTCSTDNGHPPWCFLVSPLSYAGGDGYNNLQMAMPLAFMSTHFGGTVVGRRQRSSLCYITGHAFTREYTHPVHTHLGRMAII